MSDCYGCRHFESLGSICNLGIYGEDAEDCMYYEMYEDELYDE